VDSGSDPAGRNRDPRWLDKYPGMTGKACSSENKLPIFDDSAVIYAKFYAYSPHLSCHPAFPIHFC